MRSGLDDATGATLTGWPHCVQSIRRILTSVVGTWPLMRDFGSDVPTLQDRNATARNILGVYVAIAAALNRWEPGFRLRTIALKRAGADGVFEFELAGDYFPFGHLGDYRVRESVNAAIGATA